MVAALAPGLTREGIWDAIYDRRTYGTTGERILLDVWVENADAAGPAQAARLPARQSAAPTARPAFCLPEPRASSSSRSPLTTA